MPHEAWMGLALHQAREALLTDDVPVGAVVLSPQGHVIGTGLNLRVGDSDPLGHAEMLAIRAAAAQLGHYRLDGCLLVVTLEPCLMCAGAAMQSRLSGIVFGAYDTKAGACGSAWDVIADNPSPHKVTCVGGVRERECATLLTEFFRARRRHRSGESRTE